MDPYTFNKKFAIHLATALGLLGFFGIFVNRHLFQIFNTDLDMNILRVVFSIGLIAAVLTQRDHIVEVALLMFGFSYFSIGLIAMASSTVFGFAPSGLTRLEILLSVLFGFLAYVSVQRSKSIRGNRKKERQLVNLSPIARSQV